MSAPAKARLLIVDDETALMHALCNTLEQQGYDTTGCPGAKEALFHLDQERFDLMLTDMMMPDVDGLTLAGAALRRDPEMVVVMMTGEGTIETAVRALQTGVLDYVLKPFKLGTMLPVLERALGIRRLRTENTLLARRVAERTLELEIANRELEAYAATVSHDLRAPLRGIDGLTRLLAERIAAHDDRDTKPLLDMIGSRVRRAQRLIDDLMRLSRIARQPLIRAEVDVSRMAGEVALEMRAADAAPDVTVEVDPALPPAFADLALLRQVFVNLLSNAFKYTRRVADARIEVGAHAAGDERGYFVRDNGPGFDMAHADKLFMPFERLRGAEGFEGSGVGLSIVQRIVQRHGGRVWAESAPGQGACLYFTLDARPA